MLLPDFVNGSADYLKDHGLPKNIDAAVILGSGLGGFGDQINDAGHIPYSKIPQFPDTSVEGHRGMLIYGRIESKNIVAFSGRFHRYEGVSFEMIALPVYVAAALKAKKLIISNAVGAVNIDYNIGDLVAIDSVIRQNLTVSPRKYPVSRYNHSYTVNKACKLAEEANLNLKRATYIFSPGPNYETKAEIIAFRKMGGDTVGMSTAPELFEASRLGVKTVAISLVTNMAAGVGDAKLNHEEVKIAAEAKKSDFAELIKLLIREL